MQTLRDESNGPANENFEREYYVLDCLRCGKYQMTWEAYQDMRTISPFLRAAARQAKESGGRLTITTENWDRLVAEHSSTGVMENMDKLLHYMLRRCRRPGNTVQFDADLDYPIIDAEHMEELNWHLQNAEEAGYIKKTGVHYSLAAKGWDYLMGPAAGGAIPGRCFIAMSFAKEDEPVYTDGIRPAVIEAGYDPVWMKDVLTNEDICYRMIIEIRKSQFLGADFTGLKAGVYFEAGFALGLGRQVFWTTKRDCLGGIHFDTNHYQHLVWETPAELRRQLAEKIVAILGHGPGKKDATTV